MNNEVNLILTKLKIVSEEKENGMYLCDKKHSKALLDYITNLQEEKEEFRLLKERYQLTTKIYKQRIDKAIAVINTQMKNLSKDEAGNLRIIKFNLIKGSCTPLDLTTEEDYKY